MRFMNEYDIEEALYLTQQSEFLPYVEYLSNWKDVVNSCSDGWPYWSPPVRAAGRLMEQVENLVYCIRYRGARFAPLHLNVVEPEMVKFRAALTPIKAFVTRHPQVKGLTLPALRVR